jgi:MerR family transcriptional regulator, Zn(II)-responsive regulator of zntA
MPMTVEELSRRSGFSSETIRYYTRIGLLTPDRHPGNGYRLFGERDLTRMAFIGKAKVLGLSLAEIRELIRTADSGGSPCARARSLVARRAETVRSQIATLQTQYTHMSAALRLWETIPDVPHDGRSICPLIESTVSAILASAEGEGSDLRVELGA